MPPVTRTRTRTALLLWATLIVATITAACGHKVETPPPGAQIVSSGPSDLDAASVAATQAAKPQSSPVAQIAAASPTPAVAAPVATTPIAAAPIARSAPPAPTSAASQQRLTMTATFLVTNTLGKGMALRPAPIARNVGKVWPDGTMMAGLGAEQEAYGWTWRFVRDPDGNNGWMPSNYLVQDDSAPPSSSNGIGLLPPSAPPTLILVPTMADPDSMLTPEPALLATTGVIEVVVTATPTASVRAPSSTQPAGSSRPAAPPTATRPNVNAPVNVPAPPDVPVPAATNAPVSGYAPGIAKPTGDPNGQPVIVPRVTGAQLEATRAANTALR
jgi:hypothetical protein